MGRRKKGMRREVEEETHQTRCSELASLCTTPNRDARGVRSSAKESAEEAFLLPFCSSFLWPASSRS